MSKRNTVSSSARRLGSQLGSALGQFVRQFRSSKQGRLNPDDRLVLAVGPESSAPIQQILPRILGRVRALPDDQALSTAAKGKEEKRVLKIVTDHLAREWTVETGSSPAEADLKAILSSMRVSVHDLYDDGAAVREATGLLRRSILKQPHEAGRVWGEITALSARFSVDQTGTNRLQLQQQLTALGVDLRAAPSYRGDVERLLAHSQETVRRLSKFASIRGEDGQPVKIGRETPDELRKALVEGGSVVVTGEPGAGKSATLFELANAPGESRDVIAFASDTLAAGSLGELRTELGLDHEILDVLRNWPGTTAGFLIVDALDAARGERTQEALLDLIGSAAASTERWTIAASIRKFDLRYNTELQAIFATHSPAAPADFQSSEFAALSHFNVPLLSDDELAQLPEIAPSLHAIVDGATAELRSLVRVPFNLRLLAELVGMDVARAELEPITTQLQLLDKYWEHRVLRSRLGGDALEPVLRTACEDMIATRSMRVDRSAMQRDPTHAEPLSELLSSQVLAEEEVDGLVRREVLAFGHHVLFDYAVERLLFRGTEQAIVRRTREQPELLLIVRPSYDLHFRHLWETSQDRRAFWSLATEIASQDDVPQIGKIIGPGVAAVLIEHVADAAPLLEALGAPDRRSAAEEVLRHLVGARLAEGSLGEAIPEDRRAVWSELAQAVTEELRLETAYGVRNLLLELCAKPEELDPTVRESAAAAARRLLAWAFDASQHDRFLIGPAIEAVARTLESNPEDSAELLRRILEPSRLAEYGFVEMPELAGEIAHLAPHAPDLVREIYAAAFSFEEASEDRTQMRGGVLALTSTRRQDYEMAHYALAEAFPEFLRAAPEQAIEALAAVRSAYTRRRNDGAPTEPALQVEWSDQVVEIQPDRSYIWDSNGLEHDEEVKVLNAFGTWLAEIVSADDRAEVRQVIDLLRSQPRPAALWRRVLQVAAQTPKPFIPFLEPLVVSPVILTSLDLSSLAGDFLKASFDQFSQAGRRRIEKALMSLPDEESRARDRLLGCLSENALMTARAKNRLRELREASAVPENVPPIGPVEISSRQYGDREVLVEQGVDVDAEPNRRLRELAAPVQEFSKQYTNDPPPPDAFEEIEPPLRALWEALQTAEQDGVDRAQADYGWDYASAAADAVSRGQGITPLTGVLFLATEILLASAGHRLPEPPEDPSKFDDFPGWSPPAPRIEAAGGLLCIAFHEALATDDVRGAIDTLSTDEVPAVRLHVAQRLHLLRRSAPDLMWRIAEKIVQDETSTAVLASLTTVLPRMTLPDDLARLESTVRTIYDHAREERAGAGKLREVCIDVLTNLSVWRAHDGSGQFLRDDVIGNLKAAPDAAANIVHRLREPLTHGAVSPATPAEAAIRERTIELAKLLLERSIQACGEFNEELRERESLSEDDPQLKAARTAARIIDGIGSEVYFASGAFDERQGKESRTTLDQRERLYREAGALLDILARVGFPSVTHHVLETLEVSVPFDPRGVFVRIGETVKAGQAGGYQLDSLGAALVVRLVERYLAEHRTLLQQDDECRVLLVEILDIFVQAGWPEARRLTYGLQDIFR
jgi:hypothetical protein